MAMIFSQKAGGLQERFELIPTSIVDEHIDFFKGLENPLGRVADFSEIGDIGLQGHHACPGVLDDF
jgi:purine nucleoside phosphorylase